MCDLGEKEWGGVEQSRKEDKPSEKVLRRSRKASKPSEKIPKQN